MSDVSDSSVDKAASKRGLNSRLLMFGSLGTLVLAGLIVLVFQLTREYPVVIRPAFEDQEAKMGSNEEYWVAYQIEGDFEPDPNKKYQLVVWGPKPFPYMRIVYGKQLKEGGIVGLAVFKEGWDYSAALREPDPHGEGSRISNYLEFNW